MTPIRTPQEAIEAAAKITDRWYGSGNCVSSMIRALAANIVPAVEDARPQPPADVEQRARELLADTIGHDFALARSVLDGPAADHHSITIKTALGAITAALRQSPDVARMRECLKQYLRDYGDNEDSDSQLLAAKAREALAAGEG